MEDKEKRESLKWFWETTEKNKIWFYVNEIKM